MAFEGMNYWGGSGGSALLEQEPVLPGSEKPEWATHPIAGVDDDLDGDESYFLEVDDDDDDDDYDEDADDDLDDDDDDEVSVEPEDDEDDEL